MQMICCWLLKSAAPHGWFAHAPQSEVYSSCEMPCRACARGNPQWGGEMPCTASAPAASVCKVCARGWFAPS